jgi:hypothetical protein
MVRRLGKMGRRDHLATYTVSFSLLVHSVSLVGRKGPLALSPAIGLDGLLHTEMRVAAGLFTELRVVLCPTTEAERREGRFPDVPKEESRFEQLTEALGLDRRWN